MRLHGGFFPRITRQLSGHNVPLSTVTDVTNRHSTFDFRAILITLLSYVVTAPMISFVVESSFQ